MPEENLEETLDTTLEEEPKDTEKEPVAEKKQDLESLNKQLYMRAKKAEEKARLLEEEAKKAKPSTVSIDDILEVQQSTLGLESVEISELKLRANATGKSLSEARKDENFNLWLDARRAKVEKEKALEPSSRQEATEDKNAPPGPDSSLAKIEEYYTSIGLLKKHGNPPPPAFKPRA